jgi:hypothetical protein
MSHLLAKPLLGFFNKMREMVAVSSPRNQHAGTTIDHHRIVVTCTTTVQSLEAVIMKEIL